MYSGKRWKNGFLGGEFPQGVQCLPVCSLHVWTIDTFYVLTVSVSHLCVKHIAPYAFVYYKIHVKRIKHSPIGWQLFLTNLLVLSTFYKMLEEWCSSGKNGFNIRARAVVTANLICLIIMERKAVGWETRWEHFREGWAPPKLPVSEMGAEESSARTHMCSSGSWKATHAFGTSQQKKNRTSLTAYTLPFSLKNTLDFTDLAPLFGVKSLGCCHF